MSKQTQPLPYKTVKSVAVTMLGELAGIAVIAIVADMNDNFGKVAVALMCCWLLLFLMRNATWLQEMSKIV